MLSKFQLGSLLSTPRVAVNDCSPPVIWKITKFSKLAFRFEVSLPRQLFFLESSTRSNSGQSGNFAKQTAYVTDTNHLSSKLRPRKWKVRRKKNQFRDSKFSKQEMIHIRCRKYIFIHDQLISKCLRVVHSFGDGKADYCLMSDFVISAFFQGDSTDEGSA